MSLLSLDGACLTIGGRTILEPTGIAIERGAFTTLLGPSGSGKTTLLMLIAGFLKPTAGTIRLNGADITRLHPRQRNFGIVFQSYSLFPNLTVAENIAFPLEVRREPAAEIRRRVAEIADLVHLGEHLGKRPAALSGGQQQRVALARCLVYRPEIILLDEPLSALDVQLRLRMQGELKRIHRETGATIVNVTHDQQEALSISSRIVVMNAGRIVEEGAPQAIYATPRHRFTAAFVGDGNIWPVPAGGVAGSSVRVDAFTPPLVAAVPADLGSGTLHIAVKPEHLALGAAAPGTPALAGVVGDVAYSGDTTLVTAETALGPVRIKQPAATAAPDIGAHVAIAVDPAGVRVVSDIAAAATSSANGD